MFVAGQIGLIPRSMSLPVSSTGHIAGSSQYESETAISLRNLGEIAKAQGCNLAEDAVSCVCYVSRVEVLAIAQEYWSQVLVVFILNCGRNLCF
jgi:enamine deaminase RidA (YjgF/YER057c/UK114 family)